MTGKISLHTFFRSFFCVICTLLLCSGSFAHAQTLQLKDLVIDNQAGMFMTRFGLDIAEQEHVLEVLNGGVSVQLICKAALIQHSSYWSDTTVLEKTITNTIQFDTLNNQFVLQLSDNGKKLSSNSLKELIHKGWNNINLELGPWSALEQGNEYTLNLHISLEQTDIPNWFERTLVFWSWDVAPSTSYQLDFSY